MSYRPKHILSAVDFTEVSGLALRYAARLARACGAVVTAATAERYEPPLEFTAGQMNAVEKELDEARRARYDELDFFTRENVPAEVLAGVEVIDEPVAEAMLQAIAGSGAELAVMGVHTESTTRGFLVESLPLELAHRARIPVFTVNAKAGQRRGPEDYEARRILCAVNFHQASLDGLHFVARLAEGVEGAEVHVVYAGEPGEETEGAEKVEERLARVVAEMFPDGQGKVLMGEGDVVSRLVREAERVEADLIVCGAGRGGWVDRMRRHRVAEELMRQATVPVLLAPPQAE